MRKRLILNSISAGFLYLINLAIAFIMSPFILRELGNRDYGIWEILLSLCGYLGIMELGLGPAIIGYVAKEISMENKEELRKIFNSAFYGLVLVGLVSVIIMTVISSNPKPLFNLKPGEVNSLSSICIVTGLKFLRNSVEHSVAFIMGRQEHFFLNILRSINYLVIAAIILYGLTTCTGSKLLFLSKVTLPGTLVQYIVLFIVIMYREKYLSLRWCYFSYTTVRELITLD